MPSSGTFRATFEKGDILEEMIHQAGFTVCTICKAVLVTVRRNRCTACTSSCRTSCSSAKSSRTETSRDPVASPRHSESSQISLLPSSPMSPVQEVSMAMSDGRSSREPVGRVPRHASPSYSRKHFTWSYIPRPTRIRSSN